MWACAESDGTAEALGGDGDLCGIDGDDCGGVECGGVCLGADGDDGDCFDGGVGVAGRVVGAGCVSDVVWQDDVEV